MPPSGSVQILYLLIVLYIGAYYAYLSRNISDIYAESRGTAIGIYTTCVLGSLSTLINFAMGASVSPVLSIFVKVFYIYVSVQVKLKEWAAVFSRSCTLYCIFLSWHISSLSLSLCTLRPCPDDIDCYSSIVPSKVLYNNQKQGY